MVSRAWIGCVVAWGLVASGGCGRMLRPPEPDQRLAVQESGWVFGTQGGYRLAILPEPGRNLVQLDVRYPVGAADDPPGKAGLAHLVEHLLFEVELTRGGQRTSIGAELGRLALSWNAYTGPDFTSYVALADPSALDELLALEADRLAVGCAGLTPEIFAREREVVLNELRQRGGASRSAVQQTIHEAAYPEGHPYRAIDSVESVSRLELSDVCELLAGPYRRGKAVVIASGAVDRAQLLEAAARHLGRLRPRDLSPRAAPPVLAPAPGTIRRRVELDRPALIAIWPLPPRASHDHRMLALAWDLIAAKIDRRRGAVLSAGASTLGGAHAPALAVYATLASTDHADRARQAVTRAVEDVLELLDQEARVAPWWLSLREGRVQSLLARWDSLGGRNHAFGEFLQLEGGTSYLGARLAELDHAEPRHVRELVARWLAPSRARFLVLEPSGATGRRGALTYAGGAEAHEVRVDPALADRPLPVPGARAAIATERFRLDNGLTVVLWPHGKLPLVHGRLVVDSGSAHEPESGEGVSLLVGADEVTPDGLTFTGLELAPHADDLVSWLAWDLRFPGGTFRDWMKAPLRASLRRPGAAERETYRRGFLEALYGGGHPYARAPVTERSLGWIGLDRVTGWARDHLVPRNATLIVAGRFDAGLIRRHIEFHADHVSGGRDSRDRDPIPTPRRAWISGFLGKPSPTLLLDVAFVGGRGIDADHAKRLVLEEVLASRLFRLRGAQALTYGFSASFEPRRGGGLWRLSGEVDASRAAEAGAALAAILDEVRRDPGSYRTAFVRARQQVLQRLLATETGAGAIANRLVELARFDLADDFHDRVVAEIAGLTLEPFHRFVARELDAAGQVFGAFGHGEAVQAALAAAGRPP